MNSLLALLPRDMELTHIEQEPYYAASYPGLFLHADQDVREAAVYYFARSHSSDPIIQAIEKLGFDNAFEAQTFLEDLVQTDETVRWLIQQLSKLGQPANDKEAEPILAYIPTLIHADPAI